MDENQEVLEPEVVETLKESEPVKEEVLEPVISSMTLSKLVQDMHITIERAIGLVNEYKQKLLNLNDREARLNKERSDLEIMVKSHNQRERDISHVENADKLYKDAKGLMDASNLRLNAASEAEKQLSKHTAEEHSKLDQKRLLQATEARNNEKRAQSIEDEVNRRVTESLKNLGIAQPQG